MTLSIIIVNYNVKYFLEQCLCSVVKAIEKIETEVFIVDNHSSDGSIDYLQPKFSIFRFIVNSENHGFGKANNQALSLATGKYILFLNPDTIVAEDSFEKCISFLESHEDGGALGVKMIDGTGTYLKESKRGFPTIWTAFCKLSGLTALFPRTKWFSAYYLGYLSEKQNQVVDVISGAYFLIRKKTLEKTGGFDEQFYMYAEDIDLSYRIRQSGWLNYYFAETTIIHFKGESTRKDAYYVKLFYQAMYKFIKKYNPKSIWYSAMIGAAIWLRAGISLIGQTFAATGLKNNRKLKYFLLGDTNNTEHLQFALQANRNLLADQQANADEVIFCEGKGFSFKEIIDSAEQNGSAIHFKIHSSKAASLVGSNFKNKSGETIAF